MAMFSRMPLINVSCSPGSKSSYAFGVIEQRIMSLLVRFNMLWCLALSGPLPPLETPPPTPVGEPQIESESIVLDEVAEVTDKMEKPGQLHSALQVTRLAAPLLFTCLAVDTCLAFHTCWGICMELRVGASFFFPDCMQA
jgi:hypothetical protein